VENNTVAMRAKIYKPEVVKTLIR